jgi:hypothetical protein
MGTEEINEDFGPNSVVPTTLIIDREGTIRERIVGAPFEESYFEERIRPLFTE